MSFFLQKKGFTYVNMSFKAIFYALKTDTSGQFCTLVKVRYKFDSYAIYVFSTYDWHRVFITYSLCPFTDCHSLTERVTVGDVIHDQDAVSSQCVLLSERRVLLLTCCVTDVQHACLTEKKKRHTHTWWLKYFIICLYIDMVIVLRSALCSELLLFLNLY